MSFSTVAGPNLGQRPTFDPRSSILWELSTLKVTQGDRRPTAVLNAIGPCAVMGGKEAVATSQCRSVLVNGMPSMNRRPMDHHGRLATGLTVWSPGRDSPGVSSSSSSLGMGRTLGPSPDVDIPRLYNV
jgi:hypothetical protein